MKKIIRYAIIFSLALFCLCFAAGCADAGTRTTREETNQTRQYTEETDGERRPGCPPKDCPHRNGEECRPEHPGEERRNGNPPVHGETGDETECADPREDTDTSGDMPPLPPETPALPRTLPFPPNERIPLRPAPIKPNRSL